MKEISLVEFDFNPVKAFGKNWMALTAGTKETGCNTMCVSWGHFGTLWNRGEGTLITAVVYARPQRYTKEFLDREEYFSFSVYPGDMKSIHTVCGSKSGRDVDKAKECSLTPVFTENAPYFEEAKIVIICRKMAVGKFEPDQFKDEMIAELNYPQNDFHYIYYGAIEKVLIKA